MMDVVDNAMVLLFPLLDALPFTLPRYWICRDRLRIPFRYIVLIQLALSVIYSGVFYAINLGGYETAAQWTTPVRYCFLLTFLILAFLLVKDSFPKLMFTWLLFLAWQFFVLGNANFIESRFFWDFSGQHPYLVYNVARIAVYLITFPFMFRFFRHTVVDALNINDKTIWRHFWKIPLFPTLFGMLYCFTGDVYAYATWQFMVSRYLMLFGACYVSYVALKVLEISHSRTQLEEALKFADRSLLAQKKQYDALTAHMEENRRARHDLRQHLAVVQSYMERDDKAGLNEYIRGYMDRLPPDMAEYFCGNEVVNAIISYYAAQARELGIVFTAKTAYPKDCPVRDMDISVLLGNLLENAVDACRREPGNGKFIKLRIKQKGASTLLILVDNTCVSVVSFKDGTPLSSKREGVGIGVASVREIAARYHGTAHFEQREDVFYASVRLMLADEKGKLV